MCPVQPLLGMEGDPMRLLFERDLTPHPQYAAFYKWLQNDLQVRGPKGCGETETCCNSYALRATTGRASFPHLGL